MLGLHLHDSLYPLVGVEFPVKRADYIILGINNLRLEEPLFLTSLMDQHRP